MAAGAPVPPSARYGVAAVLRNLVPLLLLYALAPFVAARSPVFAWCLAPAIGLLIYRLTMVMHDCGHGTLFPARRTNTRVGTLLGHLTGIDFVRFSRRHWEHHGNYGEPDDPQGFHYLHLAGMSGAGRAWHVLKPLAGANLRYVFAESLLHPANLRRAARDGELPALAAVQLVALGLVTGAGAHPFLALLPAVSAATFGLFFSQLRGMAEHGVRPEDGAGPQVRSHRPDPLGRLLLYEVNFNLHEEHHRYPQVPSCHLPELARSQPAGPAPGTMWRTLQVLLGAGA